MRFTISTEKPGTCAYLFIRCFSAGGTNVFLFLHFFLYLFSSYSFKNVCVFCACCVSILLSVFQKYAEIRTISESKIIDQSKLIPKIITTNIAARVQ